jgi:hypothetical protein
MRDVQGGALQFKCPVYQKFQYRHTGFAVASSLNLLLDFCSVETLPDREAGAGRREYGGKIVL